MLLHRIGLTENNQIYVWFHIFLMSKIMDKLIIGNLISDENFILYNLQFLLVEIPKGSYNFFFRRLRILLLLLAISIPVTVRRSKVSKRRKMVNISKKEYY